VRLPAAPLPAGLVANYSLDRAAGGAQPETMGAWGPATPVGAPAVVPGRFGSALQFDGKNRLVLPQGMEVDTGTPFSAGCWVRPASGVRGAVLSTKDVAAGKEAGWEIWVENGVVRLELGRLYPTDWLMVRSKGAPLPTAQWRHIFFTYDGSGKAAGVRLFINGAPLEVETDADKLSGSIRTANERSKPRRSSAWPPVPGRTWCWRRPRRGGVRRFAASTHASWPNALTRRSSSAPSSRRKS